MVTIFFPYKELMWPLLPEEQNDEHDVKFSKKKKINPGLRKIDTYFLGSYMYDAIELKFNEFKSFILGTFGYNATPQQHHLG